PDRAEPEDAVDRADHMVGRVALAELRGPDRRHLRDFFDGLLLRRRREGLGRPDGPPTRSGDDVADDRDSARPSYLARDAHTLATGRPATARTSAPLGPGADRRRTDVRESGAAVSGDRGRVHSARDRDLGAPGRGARRLRTARDRDLR